MMRSQRTAFREQPPLTQLEKAWAQHRKPDGRAGHEGGEGTRIYLWLIRVDTRQKTTKFRKAIFLQLR